MLIDNVFRRKTNLVYQMVLHLKRAQSPYIPQRNLLHQQVENNFDLVKIMNFINYMCRFLEPTKCPNYLIAVHRKWTRQESYFLSQQKSKPNLFGLPLLLGCSRTTSCKNLYESVWNQVTRLLSPMPQSDQTNHATDW